MKHVYLPLIVTLALVTGCEYMPWNKEKSKSSTSTSDEMKTPPK